MAHRTAGWFYVLGGAALGLVAAGTLAHRGRLSGRRGSSGAKPTREPLLSPEADDLPGGQRAADGIIDGELFQRDLPRPDAGGASLRRGVGSPGVYQEMTPIFDERQTEPELTARPLGEPMLRDDAYGALAPDDLGSEWLSRATETTRQDSYELREAEAGDMWREAGMSVMSEASIAASQPEQIEEAAAAHLEGSSDLDPDDLEIIFGEVAEEDQAESDHESGDRATDPEPISAAVH